MNCYEPAGERLSTGVRRRHDAKGSAFGFLHRERLPREFHLSDIDGMAITEGRTFTEYCVKGKGVAFAAFIDAKASEHAAGIVPLRRRVLCALAASVAHSQPVAPLAFEVVGTCEPFTLHELHIVTAERTGRRWYLRGDNWRTVWDECGITAVRERLDSWLTKRHS